MQRGTGRSVNRLLGELGRISAAETSGRPTTMASDNSSNPVNPTLPELCGARCSLTAHAHAGFRLVLSDEERMALREKQFAAQQAMKKTADELNSITGWTTK